MIGPQVEFPDVKLTRPNSRGTLLGGFKKGNLNTRSCGEHVEIAVSKNWIPFFVLEIKWLWVKNQWYLFGVGEFTTHFRTYFSGDWERFGF